FDTDSRGVYSRPLGSSLIPGFVRSQLADEFWDKATETRRGRRPFALREPSEDCVAACEGDEGDCADQNECIEGAQECVEQRDRRREQCTDNWHLCKEMCLAEGLTGEALQACRG